MKIKVVFKNGVVVDCEVKAFRFIKNYSGDTTGFEYEFADNVTTPLILKYEEIAGVFEVID